MYSFSKLFIERNTNQAFRNHAHCYHSALHSAQHHALPAIVVTSNRITTNNPQTPTLASTTRSRKPLPTNSQSDSKDQDFDPNKRDLTTVEMKRNIVIFLIILILFILIALIGYLIYYLQTRMAVGGTTSSVSDMTEA